LMILMLSPAGLIVVPALGICLLATARIVHISAIDHHLPWLLASLTVSC
jgi:hypothetical protein